MIKLKNAAWRLTPYLRAFGLLTAWTASPAATIDDAHIHVDSPLQVVCAPDRPLVHSGESVTTRAWVTDASGEPIEQTVRLKWSAGTGKIAGGDAATWSFAPETEDSQTKMTKAAAAQVTAHHDTLGQTTCELLVYIAPNTKLRSTSPPQAERLGRPGARSFLLSENEPPKGYGLYSYFLLNTPPGNEQERERYLKAIEAYLRVMQPMEEMEMHLLRKELNIVLLPVKRNIELPDNLTEPIQAAQAARQVLEAFDYARSKILLSEFTGSMFESGPYLVSILPAENHSRSAPLFFDMSHVVPKLVWDWVSAFCSLAAQERSWSDAKLIKLALHVRNVIAVGAREMPDVAQGLKQWIQILNSR